MGYKKVWECWEKYDVGNLLFFLSSLCIIFCCLFLLKMNEQQKIDWDTFKLNFYSQVYNLFVKRNVFYRAGKIAVLSIEVSEMEFVFGTR